jgi:hypothetical protein
MSMDPVDRALVLLAERQADSFNRVRLATQEAVGRAWDLLGNVDDASRLAFIAAVEPVVAAAQVQVAETTAAMLAQSLTVMGEGAAAAAITTADVAALRGGVSAAEVYSRPVVLMRSLITDKLGDKAIGWALAKQRARARAVGSASMDVAMAQREAMRTNALQVNQATGRERIVGYRRTLSGVSCRFCATASTQRYTIVAGTKGLMPIHHHCDCGVAPIIGTRDPGQIINRELLRTLKAEGRQYWKKSGYVDNDGNPIDPEKFVDRSDPPEVDLHGEHGPVFGEGAGPLELPLAERVAADRDKAREILRRAEAAGPQPRGSSAGPPDPDHLTVYDPKYGWLMQDAGLQLNQALTSAGAKVLAEARLRVGPRLDVLKREAAEAAAEVERAAEAMNNARTAYLGLNVNTASLEEIGAARLLREDTARAWREAKEANTRAGGMAAAAERDAVLEVLGEIRPRGSGADLTFKVKSRSGEALKVQEAIKDAATFYPEDWTKAIGREWGIVHKKVTRGFQSANPRTRELTIALSGGDRTMDPNRGDYFAVAVHELFHGVESTVPGLKLAEHAFYWQRCEREATRGMSWSAKERGREDQWHSLYAGRDYSIERQGAAALPTEHYELGSMGMDTYFGLDPHEGKLMDDEYVSWLLGAWLTL